MQAAKAAIADRRKTKIKTKAKAPRHRA